MRSTEPVQDSVVEHRHGDRISNRWWTAALLATILLSLAIRVIALGSKSVIADELASFHFAVLSWTDFWGLLHTSEANMALYYVLLRAWIHLNNSVFSLRLLSVIPAVATVPVAYVVGKRLFSAPTALLASLLFSLNTFHIYYSQTGRGYSLAVFLVTLSWLYFISNLDNPTPANMAGGVVASTGAMYAHLFAVFVLCAQFVALFLLRLPRPSVIRQTLLLVVVAIASIPLFMFAVAHQTEPISWVQPTTWKEVYHFITYLSGSGLKLGLSIIALAIVGREWWRAARLRSRATLPFVFLGLWLLLPIASTLLLSLWKPVFSPRFLMICLPAFLLLVAEGIYCIRPQWLRCLFAGTLVVSCVTALPSYYRQPGIEDWKSAATYMHERVRAVDTIIVNNPAYRPILEYSFPEFGLALPTRNILLGPAKKIPNPDSEHTWLLLCHAAPSETEDVASLKRRFALGADEHFNGIELIEFARPTPVAIP